MRAFATGLFVLACSSVQAQDLMIFDPSSFGEIVLPRRETAAGPGDILLESQIGAYNNEFISTYGPKSIFARTGRSVGRLDILTDKGHAPCTGFLVAENRVVTNNHCVPGILKHPDMVARGATTIVAVQFHAGYVKDGVESGTKTFHVIPEPLETSEDLDYTLLQVLGDANAEFGALDLSTALPGDRDPLWVIGHPMGEAQRISREHCAAAEPALDGKRLRHTCDTLPGNSGSPVIDAGLQKVVALHHAGARASAVNFAYPMAEIIAQSSYLTASPTPDSGKATAEELAALRRQLEEARQARRAAEEAARIARDKAEAERRAERERLAEQMAAVAKAAEDARRARDRAEADKLAERKRLADELAAATKAAEKARQAQKKAEAERKAAEIARTLDRDEAERRALEAAARAAADRLAKQKADERQRRQQAAGAALADVTRAEGDARQMYKAAMGLDVATRRIALDRLIRQHPGTEAAALARDEVDLLAALSVSAAPPPPKSWSRRIHAASIGGNSWDRVALSPDGRWIAHAEVTRSLSGHLVLLDQGARSRHAPIAEQPRHIRIARFSEDGALIATVGFDNVIRVVQRDSGRLIATLPAREIAVQSLDLSPDGSTLAAGYRNGVLILWDLTTMTPLHTLDGQGAVIEAVRFSPDGSKIANNAATDEVRIWNVATGKLEQTLKGTGWYLQTMAFSPDGTQLVTGARNDDLYVWDMDSGEVALHLPGHGGDLSSVAYAPDGKLIVSTDRQGRLMVWEAHSGQEIALKDFDDRLVMAVFSAEGETLHVVTQGGHYRAFARN